MPAMLVDRPRSDKKKNKKSSLMAEHLEFEMGLH